MCRSILAATLIVVGTVGGLHGAGIDALLEKLAANPDNKKLLPPLREAIAREENLDERCRLSVLYCVACRYAGELEHHAKSAAYVKRTFPGHPLVDHVSPEFATMQCRACEGRGTRRDMCTDCPGTGRCRDCSGRGRSKTRGLSRVPQKCLRCSGSGRCPSCKGSGRADAPCATCSKTGRVVSRKAMSAAIRKLAVGAEDAAGLPGAGRPADLPRIVNRLAEYAERYRAAGKPTLEEQVLRETADYFCQNVNGRSLRLRAIVKAVRPLADKTAMIDIEDFEGTQLPAAAAHGLRVPARGPIRVVMSPKEAAAVKPGSQVELSGAARCTPLPPLVFEPRNRQMILLIEFTGSARSAAAVDMQQYTCTIDGKSFVSPYVPAPGAAPAK